MNKTQVAEAISKLLTLVTATTADEPCRPLLIECINTLKKIYNTMPVERPDSPCPCGCDDEE